MSTAAEEKVVPDETKQDDKDTTVNETTTAAAKEEKPDTKAGETAKADETTKADEPLDETKVKAVADRLEFFFSDANVRHDLFVRRELTREKGDHPFMIDVTKLLKFNTIKKYTQSAAVVVAAAKTCEKLLVVSDDEKAVGRVERFTKEKMDQNIPLSLHIRNIPFSGVVYGCKSDELRDLFTQYGNVTLVKMRFSRDDNDPVAIAEGLTNSNNDNKESNNKRSGKKKSSRLPIGAALIEFESAEQMQKAADDTLTIKDGQACEPSRKLTISDNELEIMLLSEYINERKKRKAENQGNDDDDSNKETEENEKKFSIDWKPGCVIRVKGLPDDCSRETLLDTIAKGLDKTLEQVKEQNIYVDYSRGQKDGAIRFDEPGEAVKTMCDKLKEGLEIGTDKVEDAIILEGDEEKEYWTKFIEFKNQQMSSKKNGSNNNHNKRKSYSRKKSRN